MDRSIERKINIQCWNHAFCSRFCSLCFALLVVLGRGLMGASLVLSLPALSQEKVGYDIYVSPFFDSASLASDGNN
jgi:hypothetical protein